jgi:hypothetical protein
VAPSDAYTTTFYVMSGLLVAGLICNLLVRPLRDDQYLPETTTAPAVATTTTPAAAQPRDTIARGAPEADLGRAPGYTQPRETDVPRESPSERSREEQGRA